MKDSLVSLLREARISRGLKQKDVADRLGIKDNTLSNWETGRTEPDMDKFLELCDIYRLDAAQILTDSYGVRHSVPSIVFTSAETEIVLAYRIASPDDKNIVDSALRKYINAPRLTLVAARDGGLSTADADAINRLGLEMQEDDTDL